MIRFTGRITKNQNGYFFVAATDGNSYLCKTRGRLRLEWDDLFVGDWVDGESEDGEYGLITRVQPRTSRLQRPPVVNISQVLLVTSVAAPAPNRVLLDKLIWMCEHEGLPPVLCFTKADLAPAVAEEMAAVYRRIPYPVLVSGYGLPPVLDELRTLLQGRLTAVCGPSGVGKSTLLNAVTGRKLFVTQALSEKIRRGRNTTRHSEIVPLGADTFVMDTPGFGSLNYVPDEFAELAAGFKEIRERSGDCRFNDCSHLQEPHCAVRAAVAGGAIAGSRYDSYCFMATEWKEKEKEKYR